MTGLQAYALSKKYTEQSLDGLGALKGANCIVKETKTVDGGTEITFEWTGTSGTKETTTILVKNGEDGKDGNGIVKVEKIKTVDLVDTYRMTFDDGSTFDYEVVNGGGSGSGKIDIIKVNGVELPVVDKAVDIEIPDYIYIGNTEPTDENVVLWVNPDESGGSGGGVPVEYIYIGNTEPTDENIVLWINPDEEGGETPSPTPENYYTKDETEELISENVQTLTDNEITNILSEIF